MQQNAYTLGISCFTLFVLLNEFLDMYKVISLVVLVLSLGACQSPSIDDEKMPTAAEVAKAAKESQIKAESQDKIPNPIKCQQAKLN
ncbi:MAG: hypothetical protein NWQ26_10130, partial [Paraglaciecola sp.]|nr:hypothetical protein [Paraglaciecola sp.]